MFKDKGDIMERYLIPILIVGAGVLLGQALTSLVSYTVRKTDTSLEKLLGSTDEDNDNPS